MGGKQASFRIGRVRADRRGRVWYLTYHQDGRRQRPRVGPDRELARQMAAQINSQLELGAPAALSFEPIAITELRRRWLEHHEHVRRSSVPTIRRYRSATDHLIRFVEEGRVPGSTAQFRSQHAEEFVRHLRSVRVSPNGHPHATKRPLLDKGIRYILETCRAMFAFAVKRRHLSPYAENPFASLDLDRMPIENARPVLIFTPEQEQAFLAACDDWQFPLFLTLMLTGLRPGELTHLLLPDDLDFGAALLRVRNKPKLGWQVKTRTEREIPLVPPLVKVLRAVIGSRRAGVAFVRRRFVSAGPSPLAERGAAALEQEFAVRVASAEQNLQRPLSRAERLRLCRGVWQDTGAIQPDLIRKEFLRLTRDIGLPHLTAPKMLRHLFATCLQDANVDPLIRNDLMGHSPGAVSGGRGLGMTATYTHTRPETRRKQLEDALRSRSALLAAERWLNSVRLSRPESA